jgi:hypothetical protein
MRYLLQVLGIMGFGKASQSGSQLVGWSVTGWFLFNSRFTEANLSISFRY